MPGKPLNVVDVSGIRLPWWNYAIQIAIVCPIIVLSLLADGFHAVGRFIEWIGRERAWSIFLVKHSDRVEGWGYRRVLRGQTASPTEKDDGHGRG